MNDLITTIEALRAELQPMVRDTNVYALLDKCVELATASIPDKETDKQKLSRLQGKVEAYENALSLFKTNH